MLQNYMKGHFTPTITSTMCYNTKQRQLRTITQNWKLSIRQNHKAQQSKYSSKIEIAKINKLTHSLRSNDHQQTWINMLQTIFTKYYKIDFKIAKTNMHSINLHNTSNFIRMLLNGGFDTNVGTFWWLDFDEGNRRNFL